MPVQFIQATVNTALATSQTSVATVSVPSSATNGDLLVLAVVTVPPTSVNGGLISTGWTFFRGVSVGADFAGLNVRMYWKHASAEPTTYSPTFTVADLYTTNVICLRGQNGSTSAIDAETFNSSISGDAIVLPSLVAPHNNDMWLGYAFSYQNGTLPSGFDLPAGWTTASKVTSHHAAMAAGYSMLAGSATYGPAVFSVSVGAAYNPWIALSVFIAESAGGSLVLRLGAMLGVGL